MGLSKQIWKMDISDTDEMKIMEHCISEEHNNILRKQRQQSSHKLDITVHTQFVEQEVPFLPGQCMQQYFQIQLSAVSNKQYMKVKLVEKNVKPTEVKTVIMSNVKSVEMKTVEKKNVKPREVKNVIMKNLKTVDVNTVVKKNVKPKEVETVIMKN